MKAGRAPGAPKEDVVAETPIPDGGVVIRLSRTKVLRFAAAMLVFITLFDVLLLPSASSQAAFEAAREASSYRSYMRMMDYPTYRGVTYFLVTSVDGLVLLIVFAFLRRAWLGPTFTLDRRGRGRYVGFFRTIHFRLAGKSLIKVTRTGLTFAPPAEIELPPALVRQTRAVMSVHFALAATPPEQATREFVHLGYTVDSPI